MAREIERLDEVHAVLAGAKVIAVLGAHPERARPAGYVPDYLHSVGYRIIPVNPDFVGQQLWGENVRGSLTEIAEAVDIVDVFRRPSALPAHLADVLAMKPAPKVVWLQSGIVNESFAAQLVHAGIDVVQDRCTLAEHRRLAL